MCALATARAWGLSVSFRLWERVFSSYCHYKILKSGFRLCFSTIDARMGRVCFSTAATSSHCCTYSTEILLQHLNQRSTSIAPAKPELLPLVHHFPTSTPTCFQASYQKDATKKTALFDSALNPETSTYTRIVPITYGPS